MIIDLQKIAREQEQEQEQEQQTTHNQNELRTNVRI
jgi:hypothetical protein